MYGGSAADKIVLERASDGGRWVSQSGVVNRGRPITSKTGVSVPRLVYSFGEIETCVGDRFKLTFLDASGAAMGRVRYASGRIDDGKCIFDDFAFNAGDKNWCPVYSLGILTKKPLPPPPPSPAAVEVPVPKDVVARQTAVTVESGRPDPKAKAVESKKTKPRATIPSPEEIKAAMPKVEELTRDDFAALKAKRKTNVEMAGILLDYVGADDEPVYKYLFRQMAFRQYVLAAAFGKAGDLYSAVRAQNGIEYALGIAGHPWQKGLTGNAARYLRGRILADEKTLKNVAAIKASLAKAPNRKRLCEQLAFAYVACGDWESALFAFRDCSEKVAKVAAWELSEARSADLDAAKVADFWWSMSEEQSAHRQIAESLKIHAANWYRKAVALKLVSGLAEKVASHRIKECDALETQTAVNERRETGLYMLVDLTKSGRAAVSYLDEAPKGGWGDDFKTKKMVLRRIAPGTFEYMPGKSFRITKPFYIGVFEVTQRQYEMMMKANPSESKGDMRPVECVRYVDIRGANKGLNWPNDGKVDNDSYLGKMRRRIGFEFDLPTEVQWEYACRAGTKGGFNVDGIEMVKLGKCRDNGGMSDHHVTVGSFLPNAWGLYDMHGNVWEWCLDRSPEQRGLLKWLADSKETDIDPKGPAVGLPRILRGGCWDNPVYECRSSWRHRAEVGFCWHSHGFRLACPAESVK